MKVGDTPESGNSDEAPLRLVLFEAVGYFEFPLVLMESSADEYFGRISRISAARRTSRTVTEFLAKLTAGDREHLRGLAALYHEDLDNHDLDWKRLLSIIDGDESDDDWEGSPPSIVDPPLGQSLADLLSLDDHLWEDASFLESINFWTEGAYVVDPGALRRALTSFGYELIDRRGQAGEPS